VATVPARDAAPGDVESATGSDTTRRVGAHGAARGLLSPPLRTTTLAVAFNFVVVAFAALALNTAMPVAVAALHGLSAYAAVFGCLMAGSLVGTILAGDLCDAGATRATVFASIACFCLGAVVCGGAADMGQLVIGRTLQGIGGGALTVALYVLVAHRYPDALRPRAFTMITSCWVLPSLIGPFAAGTVATRLSWRWVFFGIAIAALLGVPPLIRATRPEPGTRAAPAAERSARRRRTPLAVTAAAGAGLIQYAESALGGVASGAAVAVGIALLVPSVPRLLPPGTLRARAGLPSLVLLRGLTAAAFYTVESFVPLMLVNQRHFSPMLAGFSLTGSALSWTAASWYQGRPRGGGNRRRLIRSGTAIHVAGTASALAAAFSAAPDWTAPLALAVSGFGMGLLLPSIGVLTMELSGADEQGTNSASLQLADSLCSVLLVGLAGVLFRVPVGHTATGATSFVRALVLPLVTALLALALSLRLVRGSAAVPSSGEH
jgi:MFS family permease